MVKTLCDLPYNPRDFSQTVPIVIPTSYQRQFVVYGEPLTASELLEENLTPLLVSMKVCRDNGLEEQKAAGDSRYLLTNIHNTLSKVQVRFLHENGAVYRVGLRASRSTKEFLINSTQNLLDNLKSTPVIHEIENQ
jgi:hypothetical protein